MFRKIVISTMLVFSLAQAQGTKEENSDNQSVIDGLVNELDHISSIAPQNGNLLKANLYEFGYPKDNIAPDMVKAIEYYKKAFDEKSAIAAYKLGALAWKLEQDKNEYNGAPLHYFLKGGTFEPKEQATLNLVGAGIYFYQQKNYKSAIEALEKPLKAKHATAQLYAAFSYFTLGEEGKANMLLTAACTNKVKNQDIDTFCKGNEAIEKVDLRKGASIEKDKDYPTLACAQ